MKDEAATWMFSMPRGPSTGSDQCSQLSFGAFWLQALPETSNRYNPPHPEREQVHMILLMLFESERSTA